MLAELLARLRGSGSGGRVVTHFPDFPQTFDAPQDVLRRLRELEPTADLLYVGWGTWRLVEYQPHRERAATGARAIRDAKRLLRKWETDQVFRANPGAFRRLYGRYLYWLMVAQGARPVAEYDHHFVRTFGLNAIVDDYRLMQWMYRNTSDTETLRLANAEQEDGQAEAKAAFADEYAAKDVCDYLNKRTHAVTRYDNPETPRHRSGFTTVATIGADRPQRSIA